MYNYNKHNNYNIYNNYYYYCVAHGARMAGPAHQLAVRMRVITTHAPKQPAMRQCSNRAGGLHFSAFRYNSKGKVQARKLNKRNTKAHPGTYNIIPVILYLPGCAFVLRLFSFLARTFPLLL